MQENEAGCSDGSKPAAAGGSSALIGLQANLTDQQLRIALSVSPDLVPTVHDLVCNHPFVDCVLQTINNLAWHFVA